MLLLRKQKSIKLRKSTKSTLTLLLLQLLLQRVTTKNFAFVQNGGLVSEETGPFLFLLRMDPADAEAR
jgi:hypothetical protein